LPLPFTAQQFYQELLIHLGPSDNPQAQVLKTVPQSRNERTSRIVVVDDDDDWLKLVETMIQDWFKDAETVTFNSSEAALRELEQRAPDLLITGDKMPRMTGEELVRRLIAKNVNYPILVLTGHDEAQQWVREYASRGFNVRLQPKRGVEHELKRSIEEILNPQRGTIEKLVKTTPQHRESRSLRIVILDDEEGPRESYSIMLKRLYDGVEILKCGDARDAWQELSRKDPDLFVTDIHHVGMSCPEMLARLAERKIKYPILVASAGLDLYGENERRGWGPGLNVTFLSKPFSIDEFRTAVEVALQIPAQRVP
jgi:DNA-binding NtrC family response regulator